MLHLFLKSITYFCVISVIVNLGVNYNHNINNKYGTYINDNSMLVSAATMGERRVLQNFFKEANGYNWFNHTNWLKDDPCIYKWHGIECTNQYHIKSINMKENNFTGPIPSLIGLYWLEVIEFSHNNIGTPVPGWIAGMGALRVLSIGYASLYGQFPQFLCGMPELRFIYLESNNLNGTIDFCRTSELVNLVALDLQNNSFTGTIPTMFFERIHLREIILSRNKFFGVLPHMRYLSQLRHLFVTNNYLVGTIPSDIHYAQEMLELDISNNFIGGTIPESIMDIDKLNRIVISFNNITGPLPSKVGKSMFSFYAQNNSLTGTIPESWSSLRASLNVRNNKLAGYLPNYLQQYPHMIGGVDLRDNLFFCPLPSWCSYEPNGGNGLCDPCIYEHFCCETHDTATCADKGITNCVCNHVPSCCTEAWTEQCIIAISKFNCGTCSTGPCCEEHEEPSCYNKNVSSCVCSKLPSCCTGAWTEECVKEVTANNCADCSAFTSDCCQVHSQKKCSDRHLAQCVCRKKPECCSVTWSEECVALVESANCGSCTKHVVN